MAPRFVEVADPVGNAAIYAGRSYSVIVKQASLYGVDLLRNITANMPAASFPSVGCFLPAGLLELANDRLAFLPAASPHTAALAAMAAVALALRCATVWCATLLFLRGMKRKGL